MAKKKAPKKRSPRLGVTLIPPTGKRRAWRARYRDPDSGDLVWESLDAADSKPKKSREAYRKKKAAAIAKRQAELDAGAPRAKGVSLEDAIEEYYKRTAAEVDPRTHEAARTATNRLVQWAKAERIDSADDLTRERLADFRDVVVAAPRMKVARNGQQGKRIATTKRRSPATINKELRSIKRVLGILIRRGYFSRLHVDDLHVLEGLKATVERREFLKPAELKKLFEAAKRHDAETFDLTREEKARGLTEGATPRYEPISEFLMFVLLTGMRLSEALAITWDDVDLEALDHAGNKVGEIYVSAAVSKTKAARTVGLGETPTLRRLLATQKLRTGGKGPLFGVTRDGAIKAMRRLRKDYGAPAAFSWQALRRTCSTYLCNATGIYGGASAYQSAKRCGHSVTIAEKHYSGLVKGIPLDHRTLEAVLQIEPECSAVIERLSLVCLHKSNEPMERISHA